MKGKWVLRSHGKGLFVSEHLRVLKTCTNTIWAQGCSWQIFDSMKARVRILFMIMNFALELIDSCGLAFVSLSSGKLLICCWWNQASRLDKIDWLSSGWCQRSKDRFQLQNARVRTLGPFFNFVNFSFLDVESKTGLGSSQAEEKINFRRHCCEVTLKLLFNLKENI